MKTALFKVKEGKLDTLRAWFDELKERKEEVLETLKQEVVDMEAAVFIQINNDWYLLGMMVGECKPADMSLEINIKHHEIKKECLERVGDSAVGYFFTTAKNS